MMEENNRKGPGVFYAVMGVATLVVAIIGATFAFFSATVEAPDTDTVQGGTAEAVGVGLSVSPVWPTGGNKLIPLDSASLMNKALSATNKCVADGNYGACQVYKITMTSTTNENVKVTPKLVLTDTNSKFEHLTYQLLSGDETAGFTLDGTAVIEGTEANGTYTFPEKDAKTGSDATWYFVVWLEEAAEANNAEANATFGGTVSGTARDALGNAIEGNLTATFNGAVAG